MNVQNNKPVKVNKVRLPEGYVSLHGIEVSREGSQYCCELTLTTKVWVGEFKKKLHVKCVGDYIGCWADLVDSAIEAFNIKEADEANKLFRARFVSEDITRMCEGKSKYRTPEYAEKQAIEARKRSGDDINYYFCKYCSCYHLGHLPWWLKEQAA